MSLARMASVDYLVRHTATGDGRSTRRAGSLTGYYQDEGYPPGRWLGRGLDGLGWGGGASLSGGTVTTASLRLLFEQCRDPLSGQPLGNAPRRYPTRDERIARRVGKLAGNLPADVRERLVEQITAEEHARPSRQPVVGFDLTFSAPKSVSVLWALAEPAVQAELYQAHAAAVRTVISWIEAEALRTRAGTNGVARMTTRGAVAAAFDHWDSRAGDPQLHTHVTIANRVQAADGKWRTIDSRVLYQVGGRVLRDLQRRPGRRDHPPAAPARGRPATAAATTTPPANSPPSRRP